MAPRDFFISILLFYPAPGCSTHYIVFPGRWEERSSLAGNPSVSVTGCDHAPHVNADHLGGPSCRDAVGIRAALPYKLFGSTPRRIRPNELFAVPAPGTGGLQRSLSGCIGAPSMTARSRDLVHPHIQGRPSVLPGRSRYPPQQVSALSSGSESRRTLKRRSEDQSAFRYPGRYRIRSQTQDPILHESAGQKTAPGEELFQAPKVVYAQ